MAHQAYNFTLDDTYKLTAAVTVNAADGVQVAATVDSIDLGAVAPAFNVNTSSTAPYARFAVVLDWGTIDSTITGGYYVYVEGADNSSFTTGRVRLTEYKLGRTADTGHEFATQNNGRDVFFTDNVSSPSTTAAGSTAQSTKRYIRIRFVAFYSAGTANLQVLNAWMVPL
jgi:hypothetical protein